jgi:predicted metalloprotease with PDZ domain
LFLTIVATMATSSPLMSIVPPRLLLLALLLALLLLPAAPDAAAPVAYRLSFPEPEHHWMAVEVTFGDLPAAPLELRMSRSSPGRYSLHEFAKNVYDVRAFSHDGRELRARRADPYGWTVPQHEGAVIVRYKVFGDRLDGTYLAIDTTHAHINMPAALMWARGLDDRPATVRFEPPDGVRWQVATQLLPGASALEFTAPNLQYLMDSPVEFGPFALRQFRAGGRTIRLAVHHDAGEADVDGLTADVQKIVAEAGEIFADDYPDYEPGHYTFIADYLPYASGDGMEHRNSTVITAPRSIRSDRTDLHDTLAHEFFHGWNVERIRPQSLEPFDFERANMSGELWLGEGFTQYYGPLILSRAGLAGLRETLAAFEHFVTTVALNPARRVRSAEEMSQMAAFTDQGLTVDRTNWSNTYISYYPFGGAIALALDLSLRDRTDGRTTLDDYMRAMWRVHGKPGGTRPGHVDRPYTGGDAEARLAEVSGDAGFAREFFSRYIRGREVPDYERLLRRAGLLLRRSNQGRAWWGDVVLDDRGAAVRIGSPVAFDSPAYMAGLEEGDEIREVEGRRVSSPEEVRGIIRGKRPGEMLRVSYVDRTGLPKTTIVTLGDDPEVELVAVEAAGGLLGPAEKAFRSRWLN